MRNPPSAALLICGSLLGSIAAQNSTAKVRPPPSAVAARAGGAVEWRAALDDAIAEARQRELPVFWYVPTVARSPMDRKAEIDRYMRAGPFSFPALVDLLNGGFVPVAVPAAGAVQERYGLRRGEFIEPGFLVLAPDGSVLARAHRLITLHADWFLARLRPLAGAPVQARPRHSTLARAWQAYAARRDQDVSTALDRLAADAESDVDLAAEAGFLRGAVLHRSRRADRAVALWASIGERYPETMFGAKAAAEAEGHGPFALGFEDFRALPSGALVSAEATTRAPADLYDEASLRAASRRFLLDLQQPDGGYRDSRYDFGGTDGLPNVYAAVTALVGWALLEDAADRDLDEDEERALAAVRAFVLDDEKLAKADTDEVLWAQVFRLEFAASLLRHAPQDEEVRAALGRFAAAVSALQADDGAWYHEYRNPFATASALLALDAARQHGVEVEPTVVDRGVAALLACRAANGAYSYSQRRGGGSGNVAAAAGRMPLCELALARWRNRDPADLTRAVQAAFEHHGLLEAVRGYDDHADRLGYGGFFFWYDMLYRTRALLALEDPALRAECARTQRETILSIAEIDGCFVDSHELGRCYGTACALLCLAWLRQADG